MSKIPLSGSGIIVASIVALSLIVLSLGGITFKTIHPVTIYVTMCFAGTLWVGWLTRGFNIKGRKYAAYFICLVGSTGVGFFGGIGAAVLTHKVSLLVWGPLVGTASSVAAIALVSLVSRVSSCLQG